ncbi:hypothetical protein QR680_017791 [Steinernema hermaphroditum]|uniref:TSC22 domain family protein 1 n=1 Tax=Steinernema hermaphroditum TaxID=289476 RepID=A0AA39HGI0_9BILA|nr:hypothetical protein QR680_017791 [Steinernema hermaphroditum]
MSSAVHNFFWLSKEALLLPSSTNPAGANSQIVAIDHKIEQAMDLVKTHLMFAVREEVDVLRSRIMELETTVIQLEAENAILREHVPADILAKMNMQPSV